jgi:hypothetical protein
MVSINGFFYFVVFTALVQESVTLCKFSRLPLWSSGQSSWLEIQKSLVPFQALSDFLRSSEPGTGSTQLREGN